MLAFAPVGRTDERVDVTAMDGTQLIAELGGTTGPGVVLVPGADGDRRRWQSLADRIVAAGFRVLRVDLRGHGESSGAIDLGASDRDVEGAYRYLLGRKIRPVWLVGADVGGAASLIVATRVPVAGVIALGNPLAVAALDPRPILPTLRVPLLFVAADAERDEVRSLATLARTVKVVPVDRLDLVTSSPALDAMLDFLRDPQPASSPAR